MLSSPKEAKTCLKVYCLSCSFQMEQGASWDYLTWKLSFMWIGIMSHFSQNRKFQTSVLTSSLWCLTGSPGLVSSLQICSSTSVSRFSKWGLNCSVSQALNYPTHQPLIYLPYRSHHQILLILFSKYIFHTSVCLSSHFSVLVLTKDCNLNCYNDLLLSLSFHFSLL